MQIWLGSKCIHNVLANLNFINCMCNWFIYIFVEIFHLIRWERLPFGIIIDRTYVYKRWHGGGERSGFASSLMLTHTLLKLVTTEFSFLHCVFHFLIVFCFWGFFFSSVCFLFEFYFLPFFFFFLMQIWNFVEQVF